MQVDTASLAPKPAASVMRDHLRRLHGRWEKELPGGAKFEIRALCPNEERPSASHTFPATEAGFNAAAEHATVKNGEGRNVYVTVNALRSDMSEQQPACDADVIGGVLQFADFDDESGASTAAAVRAFGNDAFSVITGTIPHERLHLYFERSEPCTDTGELRETQKAIVARLGSDTNVCNPSRIMRLAGTVNYPKETKMERGYVTELTTLSDGSGRRLTADEMRKEFPSTGGKHKVRAKAKNRHIPAVDLDTDANVKLVIDYLVNNAPEAVDGSGSGDSTTYAVACWVKDLGVSEPMALDLMLEHWNPIKAHGPWTDEDLAVKVYNAYNHGQNRPGSRITSLASNEFGPVRPWEDDDRAPHGDLWNGVRFAEQNRGRLLYVASTGQWLKWSGTRWSAITPPEIDAIAKKVSASILDKRAMEFRASPNDQTKAPLKKATQVHASLERVRKIPEAARSEPEMAVDSPADFDRDRMQFCVENGILDLKNGQLITAKPDHLVSKLAGTHFDPEAKAPMFDKFLSEIQPDPKIRVFLQRAVGYSLTGLVDEEKLFFMFGTGANGKSVFANIIAALLGEYSVSLGTAIVARNKHENEAERLKTRLPGVRLALVNETAQGDLWDDQRIKELASRERLSARFLHREAFDFMPTHKLWIRGNHLPGSLDAGHGFWRRMVPIEFGEQIDAANMVQDLDRKIIAAELPGILNWALAGCLDWRRHGLQIPASVRTFTHDYREDTDLLGLWMAECCEKDPRGKTAVKDAYSSYRRFCEAQGLSSGSQPSFSRLMTQRGIKRDRDTSVRRFVDFSIKANRSEFSGVVPDTV